MSLSQEDIINAVAEMSVKDVVTLIEAMEEKFGVSAAAAVAAGPAGGEAAAGREGDDGVGQRRDQRCEDCSLEEWQRRWGRGIPRRG